MFLRHGRSMLGVGTCRHVPRFGIPPAAVGHKHRFTALPDSN